MSKGPTFDTITAAFASASLLNANFAAITVSFDNTISRDGSTPNTMLADFDMNSNDILNAGDINAVDIIIGGLSLIAQVTAAAASATAAATSETNAATSATAAAASAATAATLTEFTTLTDTPSSYSGQGSKFVKVNSGGTALEFISGSSSEPSDGDKGDITVSGGSGLVWNIDAGVVAATELAIDAVETVKIKDLNVTTAKVALNAVTLALLEHGTTGDILYYGASGEPFRLAKGSDAEVLTLASGLPSWDSAAGGGDTWELLHVRDEQSSGAAGGTFTAGAWRTRTLNTSVTNEISGASLSSNQITLPAGTYYITALAPGYRVQISKLKLRNISDSSDEIIGISNESKASSETQDTANLFGKFTTAGSKIFELQHRCSTTQATDGFGRASSFSVVEVYADVRIWKKT